MALDVAALYVKHASDIRGFIVNRLQVDDERIDDLAADVWAKAWEKRGQYRDRGHNPKSWLFRIAQNEIIDEYRRIRARKRLVEVPLDKVSAWRATIDAGSDRHVTVMTVRAAVSAIPQAHLVSEYQLQGRTDKEVGAVLGISPGAARKKALRAYVNLRALLKEPA